MLADVNVALGVSGSIAAVKCVELAHEFRRAGARVRAITTPSAEGIIHPWSLEYATGASVVTEITGEVEHVALCGTDGWADVLVIAPATANTIGKIAAAVDDTPVTTCATTALGADIPVIVAPAMHEPMWDHPGVLDALERIQAWGVDVVSPQLEEGKAKLADEETIIGAVARSQAAQSLAGRRVVVTSGPTSESIDPVRVITNRSSGRMGRAIARACYIRGAAVTLVHDGPPVAYANVESATSADEMRAATRAAVGDADALVSAAAIGDFTVESAPTKLDSGQSHTLELDPAPKLLDAVRTDYPGLTIVGFKAEHDADDKALVTAARRQRDRIDAAFVVANDVDVMGAQDTRAMVVDADDTTELTGEKSTVAAGIADRLAEHLTGE